MELVQCTNRVCPAARETYIHPKRTQGFSMATLNPLSELGNVSVDTAARLGRISMDSAERVLPLQLELAKASIEQATRAARAVTGVKDVQELIELRTRS